MAVDEFCILVTERLKNLNNCIFFKLIWIYIIVVHPQSDGKIRKTYVVFIQSRIELQRVCDNLGYK